LGSGSLYLWLVWSEEVWARRQPIHAFAAGQAWALGGFEMSQKINPEVKAKWVAALRSGEYKQCKGRLHSPDGGFCCLGVLSDIAVKHGIGEWRHIGRGICFISDSSLDEVMLPEAVSEWAGFGYPERMGGRVSVDNASDCLAAHNDAGRTFAEIADAIEEQL
jgi:hypothetical protein